MSWGNVCVTVPVCCCAWAGPIALEGAWRGSESRVGISLSLSAILGRTKVDYESLLLMSLYKGHKFDF